MLGDKLEKIYKPLIEILKVIEKLGELGIPKKTDNCRT